MNSVKISDDGMRCLSGALDGVVKLWDLNTALCIRTFKGHSYEIEW